MSVGVLSLVVAGLLGLVSSSPILTLPGDSLPRYDCIVIGGGPAGLTAASALGRVRRTALLIDSADYRNGPTQQVHDVITRDGTPPALFRYLAREQISVYTSVSMINGTVETIVPEENNTYFIVKLSRGKQYESKKVILATGLKDDLPSTPGLANGWGKGIYWCPWCDGWEHRDKPFATLCAFSEGCVKDSLTQVTLNKRPLMLTNGTYDDVHIAKVEEALPDCKERLNVNSITVDDRVLLKIARVHGNDSDYEDDFVVTFTDNSTLVLDAMRGLFPAQLRSDLPNKLKINLTEPMDSGDPSGASVIVVGSDMQSSIPGIFAAGDANSDRSTNLPHAMWSAKRAVVFMQTDLAMEYTDAFIDEELASTHSKRSISGKESLKSIKRSLELPLPRYDATPDELMDYLNQ